MAVIGSHPHPRVLFVGWEEDDPALEEMARLVPTARLWDGYPSSIRWKDWDAVVARAPFSYGWGAPVAVLALNVEDLPNTEAESGIRTVSSGRQAQVSPEFEINGALPAGLRRLVSDDLAPWLSSQDSRPLMAISDVPFASEPRSVGAVPPLWFARDPDSTMIAGAYKSPRGGPVWSLPYEPEHPARWLSAALLQWHEDMPEAFPDRDPWQQRPGWMTRDEQDIATQIDVAEADLEREIARRRSEIEVLRDGLRSAQRAADSGIRQLLTSQGDEDLTSAVSAALTTLGFRVELRDDAIPPGQAKQEDLRVTPPGGKTGIAEVKGYSGGAKQGDLLKITKYATLFERETGEPPERQWYVCNQFMKMDPDTRQQILAGADEDLAEFAADGGAVIDTRDLFKLVRSFEDGIVTAEEARGALWTSPPRFVAQSPSPSPSPVPTD